MRQTDAGETVAVLLRGDRELNEIKLCRLLGCNEVELASEERGPCPDRCARRVSPGRWG